MEHTDNIDRMQALLNEHRGWSAMLWKFSASRRRLVLRVYRFQEACELYVLCVGCQTITGAFDWKGAQLRVNQEISPQGEALYWLRDEIGFTLSCNGGVVVLTGTSDAEWLSNFDDTTEIV